MSLRTIADHILDIAQNSVNAGARFVEVIIEEDTRKGFFKFVVKDDGKGMGEEELKKILDPFYTTRNHKIRKVGLGLPMLKFACEATGGTLKIESEKGKGTTVEAIFNTSHIDCQPVGDIAGTLFTLLFSSKEIDWFIRRSYNGKTYTITTREIKEQFSDEAFENPRIMKLLKDFINEIETSVKEEA